MQTTFPETVVFRGSPGFREAIRTAAQNQHLTPSAFLRIACAEKLQQMGLAVPPPASPTPRAS
jgi:hypothetical protein